MSKYSSRKTKAARGKLPLPLLLVAGGVLLITGALYAVWQAGQPDLATVPVETSGSPRLQVDQEVVDLGDVPVDQLVDVTFKIANTGDQTLRIAEQPVVRVVEGC
jgi:hypothetical protein